MFETMSSSNKGGFRFFGKDLGMQSATSEVVKYEYVELYEVRMMGNESNISPNKRFLTVIAKKVGLNSKSNLRPSTNPSRPLLIVVWGMGQTLLFGGSRMNKFLMSTTRKLRLRLCGPTGRERII